MHIIIIINSVIFNISVYFRVIYLNFISNFFFLIIFNSIFNLLITMNEIITKFSNNDVNIYLYENTFNFIIYQNLQDEYLNEYISELFNIYNFFNDKNIIISSIF